jgi:hypothetical protein
MPSDYGESAGRSLIGINKPPQNLSFRAGGSLIWRKVTSAEISHAVLESVPGRSQGTRRSEWACCLKLCHAVSGA